MITYAFINYPEASALVGAAESIWAGSDFRINIQMTVGERLKEAIERESVIELEQVFITDSDIKHIKKRHGENQEPLGQVDIVPEDFATLPVILNEFDEIIKGDDDRQGNSRFMLIKELSGTSYLATIQRGKRKMEIRTFYKRKSGAS